MADFTLSEVNVVAVSLCKRGANGKRFFLKKMEAMEEDQGIATIESMFLKAAGSDWHVVYSVVAEPNSEERQGIGAGADPNKTDIWASEDEIFKACHSFMHNGGLINFGHRDLDPVGRVVENWIAPADFDMVDPLGVSQTIRKGAWVIGIQPNDDLRGLIDSGEVDSVSYEGTGMRTPVAKGHDNDAPGTHRKCPKCGGKVAHGRSTCQNCQHSIAKVTHPVAPPAPTNPVRHLIAFYMKKKHPFTACVRDNTKRFGPDRAERVCARLKDMGRGTTGWRGEHKKSDDEEFIGAQVQDWYGAGLTDSDAIVALEDAMAREDRSLLEKIAEKIGIAADEDASVDIHEEDDVPLTDQEKAALAKVEGIETKLDEVELQLAKVEGLDAKLTQLLERVPEQEKSEEEEREEISEMLQKSLETVAGLQERLSKLEQGRSTQENSAESLKKTDPDAALAHALFS